MLSKGRIWPYRSSNVVELKKEANAGITNYLLKNTSDLQVNYNFNMVTIIERRQYKSRLKNNSNFVYQLPKRLITRRTQYDLSKKAQDRLHIVDANEASILDEWLRYP